MIQTIAVRDGPVAPWLDRLVAAITVATAIGAVLLLGPVSADARGYGTHEQLGMQACSWPFVYGIPCPTCGCTTAAVDVIHGRLLTALATQPFGAVMCLVLLLAAAFCLWALWRGRSVMNVVARLPFGRLILGGVVLLLGSWLYKYLTFVAP